MEKNNDSKFQIKILPSFIEEFGIIVNYIANELCNKNAAEKFLIDVLNAIESRSLYPNVFEKYVGKNKTKKEWYRIYIGNYTIFYTVENNIMKVAHIIYSGRNYETII